MKHPKHHPLWNGCATFCAAVSVLFIGASQLQAAVPSENITVNVSSYIRKTPSEPNGTKFKGFGINLGDIDNGNWYVNASQALRDRHAQFFWKDLDLRGLRILAGDGQSIVNIASAEYLYNAYHQYIEDVKKFQTNPMIMIFDPHGGWSYDDPSHSWSSAMTDTKLREYIVKNANVIKTLYDKYGWKFDYVEITNEPEVYGAEGGWQNPALWGKALAMTRIWREELDARGFQNMKILAPSRAQVIETEALKMIDSFKNDKVSLKALGGYSFHSYGVGLLKSVMDRLDGVDVEIFETESGHDELKGIGAAISDINLGTTHWHHFLGFGYNSYFCNDGPSCERNYSFQSWNLGTFTGVGTPQMDFYPFTKFTYFRQLAKTIKVGSRVHFCSTNKTERSMYTYMEVSDAPRPPITATAAQQPDGRWVFVVFNNTDTSTRSNYRPYPITSFNVKFSVPELANAGKLEFSVRKTKPNNQELDLPNLTLLNGEVLISGLEKDEMVTLRSVIASDTLVPTKSPDLAITGVSWTPLIAQVGDSVTFSAQVKNQGTLATVDGDTITATFNIDGMIVVDGIYTAWSDSSKTSLPAGGTRILRANRGPSTRKWAATLGKHVITTIVDDAHRIEDLNRNNNSRVDTIVVQPKTAHVSSDMPSTLQPRFVFNSEGELVVYGLPAGANSYLYQPNGSIVKGKAIGATRIFPANARGVFALVVEVGGQISQFNVPLIY